MALFNPILATLPSERVLPSLLCSWHKKELLVSLIRLFKYLPTLTLLVIRLLTLFILGGQICPPNENRESTFVGIGWYYGPFCLFLFVYDGHSKLRIKSLGVLEKNDGRLNFQDPLWKSTKLAKMKISLNFAKLPSSALALALAGLCWFYSKLIRPATHTPTHSQNWT